MENNKRRDGSVEVWKRAKPYAFVILIQIGIAVMNILVKFALSTGMSTSTFVVYRNALAAVVIAPFAFAFERNSGVRMTRSVFLMIMVLGLIEPVLDQNMFVLGMKVTSATYATTIANLLPALTFLLAWILRMEIVNLREMRSIAKVAGTVLSVAGAMVMTLYRGPVIEKGSTRLVYNNHGSDIQPIKKDMVKGSIFLFASCFCWAGFVILQTITLKEYPLKLSLATLICLIGAAEGTLAALVMEHGRVDAWSVGWNIRLLAVVYSGAICSGMAYYLQGSVMMEKGPVFVTAFSPLNMILVALAGLLLLGEDLLLGGVIGSVFIVFGLYMVVWGKSRDQKPQNQDVELANALGRAG